MNFPENLKIINWNYDYQIQQAARQFRHESLEFPTPGTYSHIPPLISYYPTSTEGLFTNDDFSLVHLNGNAGIFNKENRFNDFYFHSEKIKDKKSFKYIREENTGEGIRFAWEAGDYQDKLFRNIKQMVEGTTIVVIIGYSFPFFNRYIDKKIFDMIKSTTLKRIYFQDPVLDGQFLYDQLGLNKSVEIHHIDKIDNFYIPYEL